MTPFWRSTPLSEDEAQLLQLTLEAHANSAFRQNVSSIVLCNVATGSGDYTKALIAALAALGGTHAPLCSTWNFLEAGDTNGRLLRREKLPGWGNSFVRGSDDPLWSGVDALLRKLNADLMAHVSAVTEALHVVGRKVYPNPSLYTVAVAMTLGIPKAVTPWLFVMGRLNSWSHLFNQTVSGAMTPQEGVA